MLKGAIMNMLKQKAELKSYADSVQCDWNDAAYDRFKRSYMDPIYNQIDTFFNNTMSSAERLSSVIREVAALVERVDNLY
ncbi:MAG: hypothetical protein LBB62_09605 [Proteiniphilum sp.]|jgi:hypothetical protein|nr:hypothetical protein [Proteiniphilum sp.]